MALKGEVPFNGAVRLLTKVFTRYKPETLQAGDWDNHGKAVSDALNGICYVDDRQIIDGHVLLFKGDPHIEIELEAVQ